MQINLNANGVNATSSCKSNLITTPYNNQTNNQTNNSSIVTGSDLKNTNFLQKDYFSERGLDQHMNHLNVTTNLPSTS